MSPIPKFHSTDSNFSQDLLRLLKRHRWTNRAKNDEKFRFPVRFQFHLLPFIAPCETAKSRLQEGPADSYSNPLTIDKPIGPFGMFIKKGARGL